MTSEVEMLEASDQTNTNLCKIYHSLAYLQSRVSVKLLFIKEEFVQFAIQSVWSLSELWSLAPALSLLVLLLTLRLSSRSPPAAASLTLQCSCEP